MYGRACVTDDEQELAFREELLKVRAVLEDGEVFVAEADGGFVEASKYFLWNSLNFFIFFNILKTYPIFEDNETYIYTFNKFNS